MRKLPSFWQFTCLALVKRQPCRAKPPSARRLRYEPLESRRLLAADGWYNAETPADVNNDGVITSVDAVLVANVIYANDGDSVTLTGENSEDVYLDVDNDGQVSESDFAAIVEDVVAGAATMTPPPPPGAPPTPAAAPAGGACDTSLAGHYAYGTLEVYDAGWSGDEGDDLRFFLQVVNGSAGCGVEVAYHTEDGTAKSTDVGVGTPDFEPVASGTKVVLSSALTSIDIETFEDNVVEPIEKMRLVIDSITPINGTEMFGGGLTVQYPLDYSATPFNANPGFATGYIQNDESAEVMLTIAYFDTAGVATTNDEGAANTTKTARVTATLSKPVAGSVTVDYTGMEFGATVADGDYGGLPGTSLTIPGAVFDTPTGTWQGGTNSFDVTIIGDDKVERNEVVVILFSNIEAGNLPVKFATYVNALGVTLPANSVDLRINNDDHATVSFMGPTFTAPENDGKIVFKLRLDREVDVPVTLDFSSVAGSANVGSEYVPAAGSHVTFAGAAGEVKELSVTIYDDDIVEAHEDFAVNIANVLANGRNVTTAGNPSATGVIHNDDVALISIMPELSWPLNWQLERNTMNSEYEFRVRLSRQVDAPVRVYFTTVDGTANAGSDYVAKSGAIVIPAYTPTNSDDMIIKVTIIGDTIPEWDESYKVKITSDDDGGGGGREVDGTPEATAYIKNDDY